MKKTNTIKLVGSGYEIGKKMGKILKKFIKTDLNISIQKDRIEKFAQIVNEIAPWWLEEVEGFAETSGIKKEEIIMGNCLPLKPNKYYLGDCSSFLILPDRSENASILLMKIRDEKPLHQIAGIKKINGTYKYIFGTNIGNIGIAHFLNEKGLAGANNTGSPIISGIKDSGLNDCHIMRFVAEKAKDCEETLEVIKGLIRKGYVSNTGYKKGMIFLFADTEKGLIVENTAEKIEYRFVKEGIFIYTNHFLLKEMKEEIDKKREENEIPSKSSRIRFKRAQELIEEMQDRKIGIEDLKRISRDTKNAPYSLCNSSDTFPWRTLSVFIHSINSKKQLSFISNGAPIHTEYVGLSVSENETPVSLLTDYRL